jgi:hypothetical protein
VKFLGGSWKRGPVEVSAHRNRLRPATTSTTRTGRMLIPKPGTAEYQQALTRATDGPLDEQPRSGDRASLRPAQCGLEYGLVHTDRSEASVPLLVPRGLPCSRTAAIAVRQPIPNSRDTAATDAPSSPTRRQISTHARAVSDARAAPDALVSVHVLVGHNACGYRHTRLSHTRVPGRPAEGRSRTGSDQNGLR